MEWLVGKFDLEKSDIFDRHGVLFQYTLKSNNVHVLRWLFENFDLEQYEIFGNCRNILYWIVAHEDIDLLKWTIEKFKIEKPLILRWNTRIGYSIFGYFAHEKNVEMVLWLAEHFAIIKNDIGVCDIGAFKFAIQNGYKGSFF